MKHWISLIAVSVLSLALSACSSTSQPNDPLIYGLTLAPSGIDPHINASSELGIPLSSVYDTLIFQDPDSGAFVPGLAETWSISDDGLTYTFSLRQDVIFHDGTSLNADAVKFNIDYTINPENHSQKAAFMLGPLREVEVIDEYTIAFHLNQPYAPLLDSLAQVYLGIASPEALEAWGPVDYQFHQVGTGPYRFVEYVPNDHILLERNPDYAWAPSIYNQSQPSIEQIQFKFYEDPATRSFALETGEVDIMGEIPPREAERLDADDRFNLYPISIPGQPLQFFFNTARAPTDDLLVRQALITGVDRPQVIETVFGSRSPLAQAPVSAVTLGYTSAIPFPAYDPQAAASLLEQAGWELSMQDGLRHQGQRILELQIVAPPWGSNPDVAQLLAAAWRQLGAQVELQIAPGFGPLKEAQSAGEYHAIGINFFGQDPDLLYSFYHSQEIYNWSQIQNPELDSLLEQARRETLDTELRNQRYAEAFEIIRDQALLLPMRDYTNLVIARQDLEGLQYSTQGWFPFLIDLQWMP